MTAFELAFEEVAQLVRDFEANEEHYLSPRYQEAEVRADYLDKFWTALGWDVNHKYQTNPREQEVKVEKNPDSSASGRKADYAFYLLPDYRNPIFFCEAKKPSRNLSDREFYFQLVRYGRGASTPVGVLTDFEEFHIVDCRYEANLQKSYPSAQIKTYHFKDYLDRDAFGYIYWLFSREAIEAGKLKEFAKQLPKQRGKGAAKLTAEEAKPTDEAFLTKLEEYRLTLAKAFKKADESLDAEALTEATQKVIDRLVFIRFLEDKNIEADYIVDVIAAKQGAAWKSFIDWSKELDVKYNGVVFKPHAIDRRSFKAPDDKVFAAICADISHSQSKYLFSYIPIDLLGSIYERFLGKVVTATAKRADIEYKPEVRKAGGVYYTPKYIVDYIVANTVGKILTPHRSANGQSATRDESTAAKGASVAALQRGLTPKEVSKLRFADIACGSGSFLIAVYEVILHHVESYYNDHPAEAHKAGCVEIDKGIYALSLRQKQQILLDNIYGVDIDAQAVEVAQLSLFLKLLDGESEASTGQISFEKTKILPDLSNNIVCGNSLVQYDIENLFKLSPEEELRIKPFSFETTFKEVMSKGGFDAIVGNPPWVDIKGLEPHLVRYFFKNFACTENRMNVYATFLERAVQLLARSGATGMITPSSYLTQSSYTKLRRFLAEGHSIPKLVRTPDNTFKGVIAESAILIFEKRGDQKMTEVRVYPARAELSALTDDAAVHSASIALESWLKNEHCVFNLYFSPERDAILRKIIKVGDPLASLYDFSLGLTPYDKYRGHTQKEIVERVFHSSQRVSNLFYPLLEGADVKRYAVTWGGKEYIKYGSWLGAPREKRFFTNPRIIVRQIISGDPLRIYAGYTNEELYNAQVGFNLLRHPDVDESDFYFLGILNSWLMTWYHRHKYLDLGKNTFQKILIQDAKQLPIRRIDFRDKDDIGRYEALVALVQTMIAVTQRRSSVRSEGERVQLERRREYLDAEIDKCVYELYNLTDEEIGIVEGST